MILIGGSALLPGLRDRVASITARKLDNVFLSSDSSHVVANGAAYQALVHEATGHCLPGGLAVRLRDGRDGRAVFRNKFFFRTGEIIPASGTMVEQPGQVIESPGGLCTIRLELVEAKPAVNAVVAQLLDDPEVIPVQAICCRAQLPPGVHDVQLGFAIDPNGKVHYALSLPDHQEVEVLSGIVGDGQAAPEQPAVGRDPVLVFDCSSSMGGHKLRAEKQATHNLLMHASLADVRLCLVEFGSTANLSCRLDTPFDQLGQRVEAMKANGSTPMAEALKIALEHLRQESPADREKLVILTSDGQLNDVDAAKHAATAVKQLARIVCIGIGEDVSQTFRIEIASTPNDYFFADSAAAIGGIFDSVIGLYIKRQQ